MNIVHTLLRYPPASGGVEDYARELVEQLRARGADLRVETTNLKTHHPPTLLEPTLSDPPYVHRHDARTFDAVGYPVPLGLKEELERVPADIIHAHAFWYAPADIAARVARKRNIPFVLNTYYNNRDQRRTVKWQLYRILYGRATVAAADAVVVISPFEHELLKKDRFMLQRVELISPGIHGDEFAREQRNPFPSWGVSTEHLLLFAGRIAKWKGPDLAIRALPRIRREIPDVKLVLLGEDFGFRAACEQLSKALGVTDAVIWTGKVSREELLGAYAHARVFVFPSRFEAFGIVLLEAAAAGCPAVATNTSAIPYVVKDGQTGLLFEPENVDDLARKVLLLLHNPSGVRAYGAQAQARARADFSWERSVKKLQALYEDLLIKKVS